jgi:hypothetical protein
MAGNITTQPNKTGGACQHRYQKSLNRLLKVCYVPATSASLKRLSFFFLIFFAAAIKTTNEANKAGGTCH